MPTYLLHFLPHLRILKGLLIELLKVLDFGFLQLPVDLIPKFPVLLPVFLHLTLLMTFLSH